MPRNRAVAVVLHNNAVLTMFRKNDQEYYTFPGGGVEAGETTEQAVVREIAEETSLTVEVDRLVYEIHHDNGDVHYFFLCRYINGTPRVQPGTNEYEENELGEDIHQPKWLPIDSLPETVLYPLEIRNQLIADIEVGFSDQAVRFDLKVMKPVPSRQLHD